MRSGVRICASHEGMLFCCVGKSVGTPDRFTPKDRVPQRANWLPSHRHPSPDAARERIRTGIPQGTPMAARAAATKTSEIRLAHSPDCDDAFMFYALATGKVRLPGGKFTHVLADIESLNQAARQETYDVTAMSFYAYAFLTEKYVLMDCG